jgi:hypothetical protein
MTCFDILHQPVNRGQDLFCGGCFVGFPGKTGSAGMG